MIIAKLLIIQAVDFFAITVRMSLRLLEIEEWLSLRTIQAKLFASADMVSGRELLPAVAF